MEPSKQYGNICVYGTWDDVTDHQFLIDWGEAGDTCTVVLLSGYDYGGGVTGGSNRVPVKEAEALIKEDVSPLEMKENFIALVHLYEDK